MIQLMLFPFVIRIGNLLGGGKARRAGVIAHTSIAIVVVVGCIWRFVLLDIFQCRY